MTRFYGNGIVWNPAANSALCEFENGIVDTDDANAIAILNSVGFKSEELATETTDTVTTDTTKKK